MKWNACFIISKGLSLKLIKLLFLKDEVPTLIRIKLIKFIKF